MHVAHNFLSLSIELPENTGPLTLLAEDVAVEGETLSFASMLNTHVCSDAITGEFLPVGGNALPLPATPSLSGELPDLPASSDTDVHTVSVDQPGAEIVASLQLPVAGQPLPLSGNVPLTPITQVGADSGSENAPLLAKSSRLSRLPEVLAQNGFKRDSAATLSLATSPAGQLAQEITRQLPPSTPITSIISQVLDTTPLKPGHRDGKPAAPGTSPSSSPIIASIQTSSTDLLDAQSVSRTHLTFTSSAANPDFSQGLISQQGSHLGPNLSSHLGNHFNNLGSATSGITIAATLPTVGDKPLPALADASSPGIATPVRDAVWGERLGQQLLTMAANNTRVAEIRLTPAELGPLRVQIDVDDRLTNVAFQSHHVATREALETALPRLREMLAESGLSLGQTNVGDRERADREHDYSARENADFDADKERDTDADAELKESRRQQVSRGLLDAFV